MDDVPLICDPVPGLRWILVSVHESTAEQMDALRRALDEETTGPHGKTILVKYGEEFNVSRGRYEWPDAEFCAA